MPTSRDGVGEARSRAPVILASGFTSGLIVTGVLNPYDRALYLSIINQRSFLDARNWRMPFQGLGQVWARVHRGKRA